MNVRDQRRNAAIERMADHLLLEGLGAATLRPLAAAAGTSDRMLLYYFTDREEIVSATLHRIAERMLAQLNQAVPPGIPRPLHVLLAEVRAVLSSSSIKPFMNVWLDLAAGAARRFQPHRRIAGEIADGFLAWIMSRLQPEAGSDQAASAALFMALVEGLYILENLGRPSIANSAVSQIVARERHVG